MHEWQVRLTATTFCLHSRCIHVTTADNNLYKSRDTWRVVMLIYWINIQKFLFRDSAPIIVILCVIKYLFFITKASSAIMLLTQSTWNILGLKTTTYFMEALNSVMFTPGRDLSNYCPAVIICRSRFQVPMWDFMTRTKQLHVIHNTLIHSRLFHNHGAQLHFRVF